MFWVGDISKSVVNRGSHRSIESCVGGGSLNCVSIDRTAGRMQFGCPVELQHPQT